MKFSDFTLKTKVALISALIFFPTVMGLGAFVYYETEKNSALQAASGLMNFVDAKQQGVIRYLGQNRKLAQVLLETARTGAPDTVRQTFDTLVRTDVFNVDDHQFKDEIASGKRHIPALNVYYSIDFVRNSRIVLSTDRAREGSEINGDFYKWARGYSEVYRGKDGHTITFSATHGGDAVYLHANALMLTNIVNGEIGNLEKGMGAFYLAGVGKTFNYYMTDAHNRMITESRINPNAMDTEKGSEFPWQTTQQKADITCGEQGTYATNVGAVTGCRETMGYYEGTNGARMLGASMPFYDSGWTIVVEQEAGELLQPLYDLQQKIAVIALILSFGSFLLLNWLIGRLMFRSLPKRTK